MSSSALALITYRVFQRAQFFRNRVQKVREAKKIRLSKLAPIFARVTKTKTNKLEIRGTTIRPNRFSKRTFLNSLFTTGDNPSRLKIRSILSSPLISIKYSFSRRESDERNHHRFFSRIRMHRSSAEMGRRNLLYTPDPAAFISAEQRMVERISTTRARSGDVYTTRAPSPPYSFPSCTQVYGNQIRERGFN